MEDLYSEVVRQLAPARNHGLDHEVSKTWMEDEVL